VLRWPLAGPRVMLPDLFLKGKALDALSLSFNPFAAVLCLALGLYYWNSLGLLPVYRSSYITLFSADLTFTHSSLWRELRFNCRW
jgi:hypothetical protein